MRSVVVTSVLLFVVSRGAVDARAQSGVRTVPFCPREPCPKLNEERRPLKGFVDLHTHPLNHISFGGKVFHGAPDVGIWMPRDMRSCRTPAGAAANREEALSDCGPTHGAVANGCGNALRWLGIWMLEDQNNAQFAHGRPALAGEKSWPAHHDITHQQMWIDWIERAYRGGLRVMVALVTNNKLLADGVKGENTDDVSAVERAIPETIRLVQRHPWMGIARSAGEVRQIVGQDRMAVVLGIEIDDIGGMVVDARAGRRASDDQVRTNIANLHKLGVRYVFPVHVVDNLLGGSAVYRDQFDIANRYLAGYWWSLRCAPGVSFRHDVGAMLKVAAMMSTLDPTEHPGIPECGRDDAGHVNMRGLTRRGAIAIEEMMRSGMLIDVDHMSYATIDDTIAAARAFHGGYPLVSGHSSLLDESDGNRDPKQDARREDKKLARHYQAIRELGGMVGIEWDTTFAVPEAENWVREVGRVMSYAGSAIAFGTDINGLVVQPGRPNPARTPPIAYSPSFPKSTFGRPERVWDYNQEGMAHYGLIVDFLKDVERLPEADVNPRVSVRSGPHPDTQVPRAPAAPRRLGGAAVIDALYGGAEAFARTWERAEARADAAKRAGPERLPDGVREFSVPLIGPLCPTQHTGDREFAGNGPEYQAKVALRVVDGAATAGMRRVDGLSATSTSVLVASVSFAANEIKGDTRARQSWDVVIANAPRGMRFERILGPPGATHGYVEGVSYEGGFQFIAPSAPPPMTWITPSEGRAVDEFGIVGDTGGPDISKDDDCKDDTSVTVALNPIRVKVAPIDRMFDAVDVRIRTGADDIRGGPGSAFVRVDFEGGRSAEVDVTRLGKGRNGGGTIRVPLGRRLRLTDLRSLSVRHISNECLACTTDHWQVSAIDVTAAGIGRVLSVPAFEIGHATRTFPF
jgi:microsomal dipeptidase-like Zn-dependent dipeptidase